MTSAQLEELDYRKLYEAYSSRGRKSVTDPRVMFKVMAYGYQCGYLFDNIRTAVAEYVAETGDDRVDTLKLIGVNLMTEGFGAVGHPSAKTHARAGHELALRLRKILE